ncbi:MAG TPA: SDR family oxidoreductase [Baekduia sp.]|uniref:SDR family oxidoreductase n=1 Tax=Baekduia sp. TaxID=2600305 RepID=UPI002CDD81CA|nr:SDR family oxidoreductase [Baekduia sp.]HMJ33572.1 SDR family oxidoreductase [Baekduia sp.]
MGRETYDVNGKVVLVTGAARGIGLEAARRLHARGASVALVGLEPDELQARAAELGDRAAAFHADVTDWDELEAAVDGAVQRFGGIDVCIANAGVANVGTIGGMAIEDFERVIEVNLLGVWRTIRTALPHVVQRQGYVLPVSSMSAVMHLPLMGPYTMAKAGVEAFADALRMEVAHTGTKVGVAYFSFIDTDMVRDSFAHPAAEASRKGSPKFLTKPIPLARAGDAIERGVLGRRRTTYAPGWSGAVIALRGVLQPLIERGMLARPQDGIAAIEAAQAAEAQADGAPTGTHVDARYAREPGEKGELPRVG